MADKGNKSEDDDEEQLDPRIQVIFITLFVCLFLKSSFLCSYYISGCSF